MKILYALQCTGNGHIARAQEMGHAIGVKYGEGFTSARKLGVRDLSVFV